jgi:hypothetical protein
MLCPVRNPQIGLKMTAEGVECVLHTTTSCILETSSGSLESDMCNYSKAENKIMIYPAACYLDLSSAH